MKLKSLAIVSSLLLAFGLVAAACGNDDDGIDDVFNDDGTPTPAVGETPTPTDDDGVFDDDNGVNGDDETVSIMDGMFQPSTLNITSGTTVTFQNDGTDSVQITVVRAATANGTGAGTDDDNGVGTDDNDNGLFNDDDEVLSEELEAGDSTDHTFDDAGTYNVSSDTDPGLQMTITVTEF